MRHRMEDVPNTTSKSKTWHDGMLKNDRSPHPVTGIQRRKPSLFFQWTWVFLLLVLPVWVCRAQPAAQGPADAAMVSVVENAQEEAAASEAEKEDDAPAPFRSRFTVEPVLTAGGRWESNFFGTEEDEREVYTYLLSPGIKAGIERPRGSLFLDYNLEAHFYDEPGGTPEGETAVDENDYMGHLAALNGRYDLGPRMTLGLDGSYYRTRYPTYYDRLSTETERREYDIYRVTPMLFYNFRERLTVGLKYRHTGIDFEEKGEFDTVELKPDGSYENAWMLNLSWDPRRTLTVDLDLSHANLNYQGRPDDYDAERIRLNLQKRIRYFALDGGIGYEKRDFKSSGYEDEDLFTWRLALTGQAPPPTERRRYLGQVFVRPVDHLYLALEREFNTMGDLFTSTRFVASIGAMIGSRVEARVKGWHQRSEYDALEGWTPEGDLARRNEKTYDVSASLGYHITQRLVLSATVGHRDQNCNLVGEDYKNTYGLIQISLNFDFWNRGGFVDEALYH